MSEKPAIYGLVAEFDRPEPLVEAAKRVREAGYVRIDAHTPFHVEKLPDALGLGKSPVAALTLLGGVIGAVSGYAMMWYSATIDYPWNIGGRPLHSWPSFIPITFELGVLGGSLFAFFGALALARLPRLHHPVFNTPGFRRASRDRFFLVVEADDPEFDLDRTRGLLRGLGPLCVREVVE